MSWLRRLLHLGEGPDHLMAQRLKAGQDQFRKLLEDAWDREDALIVQRDQLLLALKMLRSPRGIDALTSEQAANIDALIKKADLEYSSRESAQRLR